MDRAEKQRLNGRSSLSFSQYLASKRPKPEIVKVEPKEKKKKGIKTHRNYRAILMAKKVRRTETKILNGRRDRKKELDVRIARQRERGRLRMENKRTRKERLREIQKEALAKQRKAS